MFRNDKVLSNRIKDSVLDIYMLVLIITILQEKSASDVFSNY